MGSDQLRHKRHAKKREELVRQKAFRKANDVYWIFCEDWKTEPGYFKEACGHYRIVPNVKVYPGGDYSPAGLVRYAREELAKTNKNDKPDKVYVVFDGDVDGYKQAVEDARGSKPELITIVSVPCFEVWILCHQDEFTKRPISERGGDSVCTVAKGMVAQKIPDYPRQKDSLFILTKDSLQTAIDKAKLFEQQHNEADERYGNPSTQVYKLLEDLENMKRS